MKNDSELTDAFKYIFDNEKPNKKYFDVIIPKYKKKAALQSGELEI